MAEYNFRVTTKEVGWVEIHADSEKEALLKLKAMCPDKNDLVDHRKWVEGKVTGVELQRSGIGGYQEILFYDSEAEFNKLINS